jgi:hypothetical protein
MEDVPGKTNRLFDKIRYFCQNLSCAGKHPLLPKSVVVLRAVKRKYH